MERRWALVTGASSGIGRALALRFAEGGYNLVVTARDEERLKALSLQCRERHSTETVIVAADLTRAEAPAFITETLASRKISPSILVNNAGFGVHGWFAETDAEQELALLRLGVSGVVDLTKKLLPGMIANGTGGILNVGSVYSFSPVPHQAVYAASKAFLMSFSLALAEELKGTGVRVTLLCPGVTRTEFRKRAGIAERSGGSGMDPALAAEAGYRGLENGRLIVVPGLVNRLFVAVAGALPQRLKAGFIGCINRARGLAVNERAHAS